MKNKVYLPAVIFALCFSVNVFGFVYQGRLYNDGDPVHGTYSMSLKLYDAETKGNAVSAVLTKKVEIVKGYFTVNLDFGPSAHHFNGQSRWLEISMVPVDSKQLAEVLSPRYEISSVPYSAHSKSAERIAPLEFITNYIVKMEIDGEADRYFHYLDPVGQDVEVVMYRDTASGPLDKKRPGRVNVSNINVRRFAGGDKSFFQWLKHCKTSVDRKTVRLKILDINGLIKEHWEFQNCWPCRVSYDFDPALQTVVENVTLAAEITARITADIGQLDSTWTTPQASIKAPFTIGISGVDQHTFEKFDSLGAKFEVIEYQDGEDITLRKRPGQWAVLDPVFVRDPQTDETMRLWFKSVLDRAVDRKNVSLEFKDAGGTTLMGLSLFDCWPCNMKTVYDAASNKPKESIKIAVEEISVY